MPPLPLDRIPTLETMIGQWNKNLWKSIKKRKSEKALIDMAKFPTINKIKMFDTSQLAQDAQQTIKDAVSANENFKLTRSKFTLVRDYILCHLIFNNAGRPGAIGNMTIKEYKSAIQGANSYTVRVVDHKTDYMGPANVAFNANLYSQTEKYLHYFRNALAGVSTD